MLCERVESMICGLGVEISRGKKCVLIREELFIMLNFMCVFCDGT